jgi:malate synthase
MFEVERVAVGGLKVAKILHDFVVNEVIPGTGIEAASFWRGLDRIVHDFAPRNRTLLQKRDALQAKIDDWYRGRRGQPFNEAAHKTFLADIGYLVPEGPPLITPPIWLSRRRRSRHQARRAGQSLGPCGADQQFPWPE